STTADPAAGRAGSYPGPANVDGVDGPTSGRPGEGRRGPDDAAPPAAPSGEETQSQRADSERFAPPSAYVPPAVEGRQPPPSAERPTAPSGEERHGRGPDAERGGPIGAQ